MSTEHRHERIGSMALDELVQRDIGPPPEGLYERLRDNADRRRRDTGDGYAFWTGAGVGIAATLVAVALTLAWLGLSPKYSPGLPETETFLLALGEPRSMDVAIETNAPLPGATIRVRLSGEVTLEGFGDQRELAWSDDLEAGVNRLTLPLVATGSGGGQLVVELNHPKSRRTWVIDLETGA